MQCAPEHSFAQVTYTEAGTMSKTSCIELCMSVTSCEAISIRSGTKCLIAPSCPIRLSRENTKTYIRPVYSSGNSAELSNGLADNQWQVSDKEQLDNPRTRDSDSNCTRCPAALPCHAEPLCRHGMCFVGLPLQDGTKCSDGNRRTTSDTCLKGVCMGKRVGEVSAD